jgi:hypothetical protein
MAYWLSLLVSRRTCRQNILYETLFHTVIILSEHHDHQYIYIYIHSDYIHIYTHMHMFVSKNVHREICIYT